MENVTELETRYVKAVKIYRNDMTQFNREIMTQLARKLHKALNCVGADE